MQIQVNGETRQLPTDITVAGLIEQCGLRGRRLAVELNGDILPRDEYPERRLADGDTIEIVQAIGGG